METNIYLVDPQSFKACFFITLPNGYSDVADYDLVSLNGSNGSNVNNKGSMYPEKLVCR